MAEISPSILVEGLVSCLRVFRCELPVVPLENKVTWRNSDLTEIYGSGSKFCSAVHFVLLFPALQNLQARQNTWDLKAGNVMK